MREINGVEVSERTVSYLASALWSSRISLPDGEVTDTKHQLYGITEDDHFDAHFSVEDFSPAALKRAENDVQRFFDSLKIKRLYIEARTFADDDHIAHDLWLTRQGHGAGFWDGDYGNRLGKDLTKLCESYREVNLFVDEQGVIDYE